MVKVSASGSPSPRMPARPPRTMHDLDLTVVAVATPPGRGGVGCIRLSGPNAHGISDSLFRSSADGQQIARATFGRFLEMLGAVFWGATYNFVLNPSVEALMRIMQRSLPTVFISVPKKWMQLHDAIMQVVDPMTAGDDEFKEAIRSVTGGR